MSPKSRHNKKKYVGQRRPMASSVASTTQPSTQPTVSAPVSRPMAAKGPSSMTPTLSAMNVGKEVRTIAVLGVVLLIALVVLSILLR